MTDSIMQQEMHVMKDMGVNFIRLGHYQQSRIILNLCDSLGIFVWEEIPWCRGGLGGPVYKEQARRMLTNMIEQHYNHPAVIIWGLGNENDWPGDFQEPAEGPSLALPVAAGNGTGQPDRIYKQRIRAFMTTLN